MYSMYTQLFCGRIRSWTGRWSLEGRGSRCSCLGCWLCRDGLCPEETQTSTDPICTFTSARQLGNTNAPRLNVPSRTGCDSVSRSAGCRCTALWEDSSGSAWSTSSSTPGDLCLTPSGAFGSEEEKTDRGRFLRRNSSGEVHEHTVVHATRVWTAEDCNPTSAGRLRRLPGTLMKRVRGDWGVGKYVSKLPPPPPHVPAPVYQKAQSSFALRVTVPSWTRAVE